MPLTRTTREPVQAACSHPLVHATTWAGLRREADAECGHVSISFQVTASPGVLFAIPRSGEHTGPAE